jgi:hypothetical protein
VKRSWLTPHPKDLLGPRNRVSKEEEVNLGDLGVLGGEFTYGDFSSKSQGRLAAVRDRGENRLRLSDFGGIMSRAAIIASLAILMTAMPLLAESEAEKDPAAVSIPRWIETAPRLSDPALELLSPAPGVETPIFRSVGLADSLTMAGPEAWALVPLLSIVLPGTGHLYLRTKESTSLGTAHLGLEIGCALFLVVGAIKFNSTEESDVYRAEGFLTAGLCLVIMALHRIECFIESIVWTGKVMRARRGGGGTQPYVSLWCSDRADAFGASVGLRF